VDSFIGSIRGALNDDEKWWRTARRNIFADNFDLKSKIRANRKFAVISAFPQRPMLSTGIIHDDRRQVAL
jgi:hypothetical protein